MTNRYKLICYSIFGYFTNPEKSIESQNKRLDREIAILKSRKSLIAKRKEKDKLKQEIQSLEQNG